MNLPKLHPEDLQELTSNVSINIIVKLEELISKKEMMSQLQTLTVKDAAKILNKDETTILKYLKSPAKILKGSKIGKEWIITQQSILNFIHGK